MSSKKVQILQKVLFSFLLLVTGLSCVKAETTNTLPNVRVSLLLPGQETTGQAADGFAVYFSKNFSNGIGDEDSYKFTNPDENIGILRSGKTLSIEGRKPVATADTLPIKMWQLSQNRYSFKIAAANFVNVNIYLKDAYLNAVTKIDPAAETLVSFNITTDAASVATNRFSIHLEEIPGFTTLPVQLTDVKAYEKNKGVEVSWVAENESNIDRYEVEVSSDANHFQAAGFVNATNTQGISTSYAWYDASQNNGDRYYRVKSFDKSGEIKFSPVVKVQLANAASHMTVAANPGQTNSINLFFRNNNKGNYKLSLINYAGQSFYSGDVSHSGGTAIQVIRLNNNLSAGIYQMLVFHDGKVEHLPFLVQ